jgi:membrane protein DedA with SNARE-associated domain
MEGTRSTRHVPLPALVGPFAIAVAAGLVADSIWPRLVNDHPLVLIGLSAKNRYLLLGAPQIGMAAFFVVGFLRLVVVDPFTFILGRQHGDAALVWIENRTGNSADDRSFVRKAERMFARAAPLVIVIAPSALWCVLAGASRMKVSLFVTCNLLGTFGRLLLFWIAAGRLREPLEDVLAAIERFQAPILAATITLGVIQSVRSRRRRITT